MNTVDINSSIPFFQSYQSDFKNNKISNAILKTTQSTSSKPTEATVKSNALKESTKYDLENITPQETYELANRLYGEGTIGFLDFAGMMAIGFSHQYPAPSTGQEEANNEPYNLLDELEKIASGTHETFTNTTQKDRDEIRNLLVILSSLPGEIDETHGASIDIQV